MSDLVGNPEDWFSYDTAHLMLELLEHLRYVTKSHVLFQTVFLPQGYPDSVSGDYLVYQLWDTIQVFRGSNVIGFYGQLSLPHPARVGRHIVFPLASVCLSVTKSCPLYNLITVTDISTSLHTFVKHIETTCRAQEP